MTTSAERSTSIVWINGAFGSGKTTVAAELVGLIEGARTFDPELVGSVLRRLPGGRRYHDFQHDPRWRPLVVEAALALGRYYGSTLIIPMTVTDRRYFDEIIDGLKAGGAQVHPFRLVVDPDILARRIEEHVHYPSDLERSDEVRRWRLDHLTAGVAALTDPAFGHQIDNGDRDLASVAIEIADRVGVVAASRRRLFRPRVAAVVEVALVVVLTVRHQLRSGRGR